MMYGRLTNLTVNRDGTENLTITGKCGLGLIYDELKDEETVRIEIKKGHPRRSLEANAYAWVLIDQLAAKLGITKGEVYRQAIREIGGVSITGAILTEAVPVLKKSWESNGLGWQLETMDSKLDRCTRVIMYYGSSVFDTAQMSRLIDTLIHEAEAQGIPTVTEEEVTGMMKKYARKKDGKQ